MSTVLATAATAAGIGAAGAAAGATPWAQAVSNLAMAGHAGSSSFAGHTASVFDSVIGLRSHASNTAQSQQPTGDLLLDAHEDTAPGIAGTLSHDAAPEPAADGAIGVPSAPAQTAAPQPAIPQPGAAQPAAAQPAAAQPAAAQSASAQPGAPQAQAALSNPALGNSALGNPAAGPSAPGKPVPGNLVPGNPVPGNLVPGKPVPGNLVPSNPVPGKPVPGNLVPGSPAPGSPAPGTADHVTPAAAHGAAAHLAVRVAPARRPPVHHAAVHNAPVKPYHIYDSVSPSNIPPHKTAAVYANGAYAASSAEMAGRGHVLWIDTNGSDPHADALDVEPGDATPAGAAVWVRTKLSSDHNSVAIVYTMLSQWQAVKNNVAGLPQWMQDKVRYWIADPTNVDHVVPGANATQWYWGQNYDITTANPGFWS